MASSHCHVQQLSRSLIRPWKTVPSQLDSLKVCAHSDFPKESMTPKTERICYKEESVYYYLEFLFGRAEKAILVVCIFANSVAL